MVAGAQPAADGAPAFDVALFVGYHARAGHGRGTIAHTYSGRPDRDAAGRPADRRVRAQRPGPRGLGHPGRAGRRRRRPGRGGRRPGCPGRSGSWSRTADGTHSAISVHPAVARERIRAAAEEAVRRAAARRACPPLEVEPPVVIEVDYAPRRRAPTIGAIVPGAERVGDRDGPLRRRRPGRSPTAASWPSTGWPAAVD